MKNKAYVIYCTLVAALGGFLFGFDSAVISGTTDRLQEVFTLTDFWLGFTVASALIGTVVGSIIVGRPADVWGRRRTMFVLSIFYLVSAIGCAFPWDWYSLLAFRFIGGLAIGGASVACPMYIAEISPASYRGRLVAVQQFNIVLGILASFFSNYIVAQFSLGADEWRWMFGVAAAPAALFFALIFFIPESPRWLVARRQEDAARAVLTRLGTDTGNVETEIAEIRASLEVEHQSLEERFFQRKYRQPIMLAIAIAMFNQLSGINVLMYYAKKIFQMAGAESSAALLQAVAIGGTNLLFTMLALLVIDRFGRKKLMLAGSIGYIVSLAVTAAVFYYYGTEFTGTGSAIILTSLLVFIASHAFGQGAVIWVFLSEIFPNRVRARGQALGSFTHWFMAAAINLLFPIIAAQSGGHPFAFFAAMMVLQLVWVLRIMPETKGVPLEQIQKKLGIE